MAAPTRLFACRNYRCGSPHVRFKLRFARFHQLSCRTVPVQIWGADSKIKNDPKVVIYFGSPNQIRTGVLALKGRCPGPLDDGAKTATFLLETPPNYNRHLYLCQGFLCRCFYYTYSAWAAGASAAGAAGSATTASSTVSVSTTSVGSAVASTC